MGDEVNNALKKRSRTPLGAGGQSPLSDMSEYENLAELGNDSGDGRTKSFGELAARSVQSGGSGSGGLGKTMGGTMMQYGMQQAKDPKTGAMMMTNPYVAGAGAGLLTYSAIQEQKAAEEKAEYDAEVDRLNAQQNAMTNLAQIAQRFKSL